MPVPGRGAVGTGFTGSVFAKGAVVAPVSILGGAPGAVGAAGRGAVGAIGGRGALGGAEGAIGTVAAGGCGTDGRAGGGVGRDGAASGAGGNFTGEVADFGAGGGSGAEGNWIGAVAFFGAASGTPEVTGVTGDVDSRGWVVPSPGRARRVIRTVSFFSGTAEVLGVLGGGGDGRFSDSLMTFWGNKFSELSI